MTAPPDPHKTRPPDVGNVIGGPSIEPLAGAWIPHQVIGGHKYGCGCGWAGCPRRLRRLHDLLLEPCITHGMPASWEHMEALGLDPLTGEVAA